MEEKLTKAGRGGTDQTGTFMEVSDFLIPHASNTGLK